MHYTLCDTAADIFHNACESGATHIEVDFAERGSTVAVTVRDNGKGIERSVLEQISDPFYTDGEKHPRRKTGFGLAFLAQTAEQTEGSWHITSSDAGTTVTMQFTTEHIDTPPVGDVALLFRNLFVRNDEYPAQEVTLRRVKESDAGTVEYSLTTRQIQEALGDLQNAETLSLLYTYLQSQETG